MDDKLTARQQKALAALLAYRTHKEAAAACGISDRRLREYLQIPAFKQEYRRRLDLILNEATAACKQAMTPALQTLFEIATDKDRSDSARIWAATSLLNYGLRLHDAVDVTARIEALERIVDDEGQH